MLRTALVAAALALALPGPVFARCEGIEPGQPPQNTSHQDVGQTFDEILDRGFIEFAVYADYPPYSWDDAGSPRGLDIEVGRLIAGELGVESRFRFVEAGENMDADLMNYVWKGAVVGGRVSNVMLRVPYDSTYACRIEQVVFTGQYATETIAIAYAPATYPDGGPKPAYFRYDTVGVENDSIADFYLTGLVGTAAASKIHRYPSTLDAMKALASGEVMAAMGPRGALEAGLTPDLAVHTPPMPNFAVGTWTLGVAIHQSHRDLAYAVDDAIAAGLADGRIPAIFDTYGVTFQPPDR